MFKPEMRNVKNGPSSRALMAVKYPTRDTLRSTDTGGDSYNIGFNSGLYMRTFIRIPSCSKEISPYEGKIKQEK